MSNAQRIHERRWQQSHPEIIEPRPVQSYPEQITRADVLFVIGYSDAPGWWETRGKLCVDLAGVPAAAVTIPNESRLSEMIEEWGVRLVINRALLITPETTERLAQRFPHVKFVAVTQSSYQFLITTKYEWGLHYGEFWRLANEYENCFISTPDERNTLGIIRPDLKHKLPWIPNPARIPEHREKQLRDPPVVSCINAGRSLKNNVNQILGYALAFKQRELRLLVSVRNEQMQLAQMCDALRIEAEFVPWLEWQEYIDRLWTVDVCLQSSYTESFNYVALEHLLCGSPVVGSDAIRYIPERWQVRADTPAAIAHKILEHLDEWPERSEYALTIGLGFAETQNHKFNESILRFLA